MPLNHRDYRPDGDVLSARWPTSHLQSHEANRLLRLADPDEYVRLVPYMETVRLRRHQVVYERNRPVEFVYFPQSGILATVSHLRSGRHVDVGTIGNEGMLGLPVFLMSDRVPLEARVHVPGVAKRIAAPAFRELLSECSNFHMVLHRYTLSFLTQVSQSAACNRAHDIAARCARWLLMTHDRMGANRFPLTHDMLAAMLGVRRPGVSLAAAALQDAGLIRYKRGRIEVTNRAGLEAASCECYGIVRDHLDAILSDRKPGEDAVGLPSPLGHEA